MVLNYKVDLDKFKTEEEKYNPKNFVSKQSVLLNALATRMPQNNGTLPPEPIQSSGWGKTNN